METSFFRVIVRNNADAAAPGLGTTAWQGSGGENYFSSSAREIRP